MTSLAASSRIFVALLGIGGLAACDTLGDFQSRETVAMADGDTGMLGTGETAMSENPYVTSQTPISSAFPVRGLDDTHGNDE